MVNLSGLLNPVVEAKPADTDSSGSGATRRGFSGISWWLSLKQNQCRRGGRLRGACGSNRARAFRRFFLPARCAASLLENELRAAVGDHEAIGRRDVDDVAGGEFAAYPGNGRWRAGLRAAFAQRWRRRRHCRRGACRRGAAVPGEPAFFSHLELAVPLGTKNVLLGPRPEKVFPGCRALAPLAMKLTPQPDLVASFCGGNLGNHAAGGGFTSWCRRPWPRSRP